MVIGDGGSLNDNRVGLARTGGATPDWLGGWFGGSALDVILGVWVLLLTRYLALSHPGGARSIMSVRIHPAGCGLSVRIRKLRIYLCVVGGVSLAWMPVKQRSSERPWKDFAAYLRRVGPCLRLRPHPTRSGRTSCGPGPVWSNTCACGWVLSSTWL